MKSDAGLPLCQVIVFTSKSSLTNLEISSFVSSVGSVFSIPNFWNKICEKLIEIQSWRSEVL